MVTWGGRLIEVQLYYLFSAQEEPKINAIDFWY